AEVAAAVAVAVEVRNRMRDERVGVRLGPLGGPEQTGLLAVPGRVDDGALRTPALLVQLTQRAGLLELGHLTRDRVFGAVYPRVVVVAANDPLVGLGGAGEPSDDVVHPLEA